MVNPNPENEKTELQNYTGAHLLPIAPARNRHNGPDDPQETTYTFQAEECPYCGLSHHYSALNNPEVALGGLCEVGCLGNPNNRFYIILPEFSPAPGVPSEVIHYARQKLIPYRELHDPIVPQGIDVRMINEQFSRLP